MTLFLCRGGVAVELRLYDPSDPGRWLARRELEHPVCGDALAHVYPRAFGAELTLSSGAFRELVYHDVWTYDDLAGAVVGLLLWDVEREPHDPPGPWTRHRPSNRRRPDGDPAHEYVAP